MNPNMALSDRSSGLGSNVFARLVWKEFRQLLPLLIMLAALSLVLNCISLLNRSVDMARDTRIIAFLGFPVLFAAGVGAMLVSQERDSRTLQWMASLPIAGVYQARIKWFVGVCGLIVAWCLSGLLFVVTSMAAGSNLQLNGRETDIPFYLTHSVFLLFAGLACAWCFRSTFVGLLALVGATIFVTLFDAALSDLRASDLTRWIALVVFCVFAIAAAQWTAKREYQPMRTRSRRVQVDASKAFLDASKLEWRNVLRPRDALLWQFAKQNRWLLLGATSIFLTGCVLLFTSFSTSYGRPEDNQEVLVIGFGCFGLSAITLGLSVFIGDSLHQRIRFLSDRGVSQRAIWLTRQAIPMSLLIMYALISACLGIYLNFQMNAGNQNVAVMSLFAGAGVTWVIYAIVQWTSQVLRSPVLSAIVAPVGSILLFIYIGMLTAELGLPVWVMPILLLIPFIATFRATRYWMDVRVGKWFWIEHAFWLAVFIVLPLLPACYGFLTLPSMPAKELAIFEADAKRFQLYSTYPIGLHLPSPQLDSGSDLSDMSMSLGGLGDEALEDSVPAAPAKPKSAWENPDGSTPELAENALPILERLKTKLGVFETAIAQLPADTSLELTNESERLRIDTTLLRMKLEGSKFGSEEEAIYRRAMRCMGSICKGIRKGTQLQTQKQADTYDEWLLQELRSKPATQVLDKELWEEMASYLRDSQSRNAARYRALVIAWNGSLLKQAPSGHLGKYAFAKPSSLRYVNERAVGMAAWEIKQYLFATNEVERAKHRDAIAETFGVSVRRFGMPIGSSWMFGSQQQSPCESWFGKWESEVDSLKLSSEDTK